MKFRKRILNPLFFFFNILATLGFVFALLAPFVSPSKFTLFAFAATGFPLLLLINVLFLIWWLVQFDKRLIIPIVTLLMGYFALGRTYRFGEAYLEIKEEDKLRVMTYNVRSFNRYQWLDDPDIPIKIQSLIKKLNPDIILFQEYHRNQSFELKAYPYREFGDHQNGSIAGLAIYSRLPLEGIEKLRLDHDNQTTNLLRTKLNFKGKKISIYNIHLASVGLEQPDYETLQNPNYEESENLKSGLRKIVGRLHNAYQKRAEQIAQLRSFLEADTNQIILGGDFNDVPQSYPYSIVSDKLLDSFSEGGGQGFGNSYARGPIPLRIDYLWHSEKIKSQNYQIPEEEFSDHYPLLVDFTLLP